MSSTRKTIFEGIVQPWGNSLGIRITRPISIMADLGRGDKVAIEVTEDGLLIRPKKAKKHFKFPYSEADLISGMTPHKAHADELPQITDGEIGD